MGEIKRKDTGRGRFYEKDGKKCPSVTTILGLLGKPALVGWAAKEERLMVIEAAGAYYEEVGALLAEPVSRQEFVERVLARLGEVKAHRKLMREAANIGTQVHNRIEWELKTQLGKKVKGPRPELTDPKAIRSYSRWEEWKEMTYFRPLDIELSIFADEPEIDGCYAGTMDLLAEVEDPNLGFGVEVLDWKTGKHIYAEAFLQNAAYRRALHKMGIHTDRGRIVRLPKEADDPEFETEITPPLETLVVPFVSLIPVWRWNQEMEDRRKPKGGDKTLASAGVTNPDTNQNVA